MTLTLEKIAKMSGVSRSTVSRVINNDPNVSQETRERVSGVIREYNFQPNLAARGLAVGRTRVIGIVIPMGVQTIFVDPYFPQLIQGVSSAANANEHSVMLWLAEPEYERRTITQILHSGLIDGVVVASMITTDPIVEELYKAGFPFILVGRHPTNTSVSYVDVDNMLASRELVLHMLRYGYRKIATITGPMDMIAGIDRLEGYYQALRERGIPINPHWIVDGDFSEAGGYAAMQRLLSQDIDAVFAASDTMAAGAIRALREAGRRIPEDVAVAGFDDMPFAGTTTPPLTTIRQSPQKTGAVAAETLIDMIEHGSEHTRRILLPTEIVLRSSCCPP